MEIGVVQQLAVVTRPDERCDARMLANVSLKGWKVYRCLAAPSAVLGFLSVVVVSSRF